MNEYDRWLFDGRCPYTDNPCDSDMDCNKCEVNEEERRMFEEVENELSDKSKTETCATCVYLRGKYCIIHLEYRSSNTKCSEYEKK